VTAGPSTGTQVASLCRDLEMKTREYDQLAQARANAEVDYKSARARRILRARAEGSKSIAEAETIAAADPALETLWRQSLIADAMVDAAQKSIWALRERIGYGRSLIATERAADLLQAGGYGGSA